MGRTMLLLLMVATAACPTAMAGPGISTRRQSAHAATFPKHLAGNVSAVAALLERVLPGSSSQFELSLAPACPGIPAGKACFSLSDGDGDGAGRIVITGTSASELTGGLGVYLREYCQMTFGWERGGASRVFTPTAWPRIGSPVSRSRSVPFSHVTQVCTHSYTLVWHDWQQWETFIDWMALAGHNSIVAPTGQEEIQYKIFTELFGLTDMEVRSWTNGPAFLTWSRGQNSHGNSIAGPLPRSFMQGQWVLAKQILSRYRELGIAGHQPAFAGYTPWALAVRANDTKKDEQHPFPATRGTKGAIDTAWLDGRDELFTRVGDAWMKQIIADFGTDHVWQMDGFFSSGTGWGDEQEHQGEEAAAAMVAAAANCTWSTAHNDTYLKGCAAQLTLGVTAAAVSVTGRAGPCKPEFATLGAAQTACASSSKWRECTGVTYQDGTYQLRSGSRFLPNVPGKVSVSWKIVDPMQCKGHSPSPPGPPSPPPGPVPTIDPVWLARAQGAYGAVARADGPLARWILQGWMLRIKGVGFGPAAGPMRGELALSRLKAFAAAAPPGNFIVTDMDETGAGQWEKWNGDWGLPFIWTALHVFGGNMGIKGNLTEINAIPFKAPPLAPVRDGYNPKTQAVGVGYTPEGLDQNPAYYELLQEAAFKDAAEPNLTDWLVRRAHRRYGLPEWQPNREVGFAWAEIGGSGYANDGQVHDPTAVGTLSPSNFEPWTGFGPDNRSPTAGMCMEWRAWHSLLAAAPAVASANIATPASQKFGQYPKTFSYDLVDIGREVLAQLTIPMARNFSTARGPRKSAADINRTAALYEELLLDLDSLLATDSAFLLGPWLDSARRLGGNATDCTGTVVGDLHCADFMEWNARSQLTTWKPTPKEGPLGSPNDYAKKHWSGLISGYYVPRVRLIKEQALATIAEHGPAATPDPENLNTTKDARLAMLAYKFQTAFGNGYPLDPVGDPAVVSAALLSKWGRFFTACAGVPVGYHQ